eukprot:PITA_25180
MLHRPIHAATLFLNPAFSYKCAFDFDGEVMERLHSCIQKMVPNLELHNKNNLEIQFYWDCVGLFGFDDAIREKTLFMPHIGWQSYGARAPNLQKLAIRILSQTCSSSGCECNWSAFEKIHSKKHNRYNFEDPSVEQLQLLYFLFIILKCQESRLISFFDTLTDAISLDNIDILSQWRVESEVPILEGSLAWLELEEPLEQGQQEEEDSGQKQHKEEEEEGRLWEHQRQHHLL